MYTYQYFWVNFSFYKSCLMRIHISKTKFDIETQVNLNRSVIFNFSRQSRDFIRSQSIFKSIRFKTSITCVVHVLFFVLSVRNSINVQQLLAKFCQIFFLNKVMLFRSRLQFSKSDQSTQLQFFSHSCVFLCFVNTLKHPWLLVHLKQILLIINNNNK